jgi:hypothetical protein
MTRPFRAALAVLLIPFGLAAQQALTGTITGTVLDASEAAVPNAQVAARNVNTGLERTATTNELGIYSIPLLPVGEYEVSAKAQGFNDAKAGPIRVGVGQAVTVPLRLTVGAVSEQVTVQAQAAAIEVTRTSVASSVDASQISNLGLNGRDFLNFILLTPGVTRDVRTGDLSFAGQRGTLNNLQVDGADNNNNFFGQALGRTGSGRAPYQFSVDSVEEFQVNTNAYSAEFGRAGGAVINVVTKSGTNGFHGSAFEVFRDRYMNANTWINNSAGRPRQPFHVNQFGGTFGGPVVRNKNFFFGNYDGQRRRLPNPVFLGVPIPATLAGVPANQQAIQRLQSLLTPYPLAYDQDVFLVKNDWHLSDGHRLSVRYNRQKFNGEGLEFSGSQVAHEHSGLAQVKTDTVTASLSSVFTPALLNEFRFQFVRDDEPGTPYSTGVETVLRHGGVTALSFGSSAISPRYTNIKGLQFLDNLTRTRGRHTVRAASYVQAFPGEGTPGFPLSFKRRFQTRYQVTLAYTYSKAIDDIVDFTSVAPFNSTDDPKHPQYGLYPGLDRGPSVNDQRQRVVTSFLWDLDYFRSLSSPVARRLLGGWSLSGIILAQTGQPFSNGVGGDPNNDSNGFTDRVPQDGRNTNYAPTIANWDLRAAKDIPLRERLRFGLSLDLFNAFNHANFIAGDIRNGRYNWVAATNSFTPLTNFGTYSRQTLDNRVLQISGKIAL